MRRLIQFGWRLNRLEGQHLEWLPRLLKPLDEPDQHVIAARAGQQQWLKTAKGQSAAKLLTAQKPNKPKNQK